ncbi:MAG: hypothetical protein JKY52_18815 [Flavobacteriales bacterium]|nr:hypothetical protein [Flavobacteriales bacterium]
MTLLTPMTAVAQTDLTNVVQFPDPIEYVANPDPNDSTCIREIERAKRDIENGKVAFSQPAGFLFGHLRYETELRQLCDKHGLVFRNDMRGCTVTQGQTQGCYGAYMNKTIIEKFGPDFKDKLHREADSIVLANATNDTLWYYECDERQRLPSETKRTSDYIPSIIVTDIEIKEKKSQKYGGWPFIDLSFIVETDGSISAYYLSQFVPVLDQNREYKDELVKLAIREIKDKYPLWVPAKIKGTPVRAYNNVRVYFEKK